MPRPKSAPASPSHLVPPLLRWVRARGGEPLRLIRRFRLPENALDLDEVPLSAEDLGALFDRAAGLLGEPHLGLALPAALEFRRYALPELAARSSPTLRESLRQFVRFGALVNDALVFAFDEEETQATFSQHLPGHPRGVSRHLNEFALAAAVHHGRLRVGTPLRPEAVHFIHARPRELGALEQFFGTTALHFGRPRNALVLSAATLDLAQHTADPRLFATAEHWATAALGNRPRTGDSLRAKVEALVREQLEAGGLRMRSIARSLRMSTRTLQRRLADEGTTFAAVLDGVRESLAREWVALPEPSLGEIAFRLGFSEFATFSRAFKRWTGVAPGMFRSHALG